MIDAGSTGSRIHVYRFRYCAGAGAHPMLEDEVFRQTKPGLSAYASDPDAAASSLDPLLHAALEAIPPALHACTPVEVKATAGLRLLGPEPSQRILDRVRERLQTTYPFRLAARAVDPNAVAVMEGRDEGVYAWVTVNYLLGNLDVAKRAAPGRTAAVMDLGGASTQIVFEPTSRLLGQPLQSMPPGDHRYELTFSGQTHVLYQHSYLGYGLMEGRKAVKNAVVAVHPPNATTLEMPCFAPSHTEAWEHDKRAVQLQGSGGGFASCSAFINSNLFKKSAPCPVGPCSFDGIYQPRLSHAFRNNDIYVFSYFYDRTEPLGLPERFRLADLRTLAQRVVEGMYPAFPQAVLDVLAETPDWCLDLTFIYALLTNGYELPDRRQIVTAKKINGIETGWCLGAAIALLDREAQASRLCPAPTPPA
ncbi:hypothetical protein CXG81DRAFT_13824 [Caulochytrium protostelioides]|uniref:guanosine-diphosphatase n=1 Tax=Caulochytrium protostelioides TaxID=1555241 RepID=A0A4P9X4G9_9FUNG|nr:hypothetical protein CXG81DRAFT_13824 [Caulochytrium protostelioides]|eukprot:RKO99962.1 hypothetical protein CXG81DRAFT_13824 [Caulochytrium protostelioides]